MANRIRGAAFIVLGALGIQEGSYVLLGAIVGLDPALMLALALAKRATRLNLSIGSTPVYVREGETTLGGGRTTNVTSVVVMASPAGRAQCGAPSEIIAAASVNGSLDFDRRLKPEFHDPKVTSDAVLLPFRELDEAFGLTEIAGNRHPALTGRRGAI